MNIKDLGDSISHFNGLAVCIVSSDSYKVLYCNQNFKGIIPNVDVGSNINEIFPKFTGKDNDYVIESSAPDFSIFSSYNGISAEKYVIKEANYDIDEGSVDCILIIPISTGDSNEEMIKSVYSNLFTKSSDFVIMIDLLTMKYFYSSAKDIPILVNEQKKEYDWNENVNTMANDFVDETYKDIFLSTLSERALKDAYEDGGYTQYIEYDHYTDGICERRSARVYFIDYNDVPFAVVAFQDKN
ncbi:MAG: hypothetical protein LKG21_08615 [Ruminococcus sp.]|jgi:hypothetical protein|nr:hypothetical protein [Ruminococcus sp.]